MKFIRILLIRLFGFESYLRIVSRVYIDLIHSGFLKRKYPELFFLKKIIEPGFTCIDIGANLGYYSFFLSRFSGRDGMVYAIEPIPMFAEILKSNVRKSKINNITVMPYALGGKEGEIVMATPEINGLLHHGMTRIPDSTDQKFAKFFTVKMKVPDVLFSEITKLDFVKCDVEGYEYEVLRNMENTLRKFKPLLQVECCGEENRNKLINLLSGFGYDAFYLTSDDKLTLMSEEKIRNSESDFYFAHPDNQPSVIE